jgi:protein-tyrosine phosphatase
VKRFLKSLHGWLREFLGEAVKRILVVCTANICRSPMVAGILRARLAAHQLADQVEVHSAGVYALVGEKASAYGVELLAAKGIDISRHRAAGLTELDVQQADLILVMEEKHRQSIFHYSPADSYKVMLLSELANERFDLKDPYGQNKAAYVATLAVIERIFDIGWQNLLTRLEERPLNS